MSLQTRLMTAVIGFVSLILIIVAVITSATLGKTMEDQLDQKLSTYAHQLVRATEAFAPSSATAQNILDGPSTPPPGLLFAVWSPVTGYSGLTASTTSATADDGIGGLLTTLTGAQMAEAATALKDVSVATVTLTDLGSYRVMALPTSNGLIVVTGLPVTRSRTSSRSC